MNTRGEVFAKLITDRVSKRRLDGVRLADESGHPPGDERMTLLDMPRLSLCLEGVGRYRVRRGDRGEEIEIQPGEVLFAMPHCAMEPVAGARYKSLGLLLHPKFTRFLLGEARPTSSKRPWHRFTAVWHCPLTLSEEVRRFVDLITPDASQPVLCRLVELILLKAAELPDEVERSKGGDKARFTWQTACQFVDEHLQHPITRKDVAGHLNIHPNHVSRLFASFGPGFSEYLLERRLRRARSLLPVARLNLSEIGPLCGFNSASYFSRTFKNQCGRTPADYRSRVGGTTR
jgi:AraC-like DNA-binding protein